MSVEEKVAAYYEERSISNNIIAIVREKAEDPENITLRDLAPYDNMHIGGFRGTQHLLDAMQLSAGAKVLELGSGMGGPARYIADAANVHVSGIDITPAYQDVAAELSALTGMQDKTEFFTATALGLPFDDGVFDAAYMIHVGMNVEDKAGLIGEAARVLKLGGTFGIYDIMGTQSSDLNFPMPWAETTETSFVRPREDYREILQESGFEIAKEQPMREFAETSLQRLLEAGDKVREAIHGNTISQKSQNLYEGVKAGLIAPAIIIARRL